MLRRETSWKDLEVIRPEAGVSTSASQLQMLPVLVMDDV